MSYPEDLQYTQSHEWVRIEGDVATIGISWFAQDSMGDVVHVELAEVGAALSKGSPACEIESVKAVSDVYSPVSGEVIEINEALEDGPEAINEDPYGGGWLFKIRVSGEADGMLDSAAYRAHCEA